MLTYGWGDVSVGSMFAGEAQKPEFVYLSAR